MFLKKNKIFWFVNLIVFLEIFFFIILCFGGDIKGSYYRTFFFPAVIKNNNFASLNVSQNAIKEKEEFFLSYNSQKGFYGLKEKRFTIEGYPIVFYVYTNNGNSEMIIDYTKDPYGPRKFIYKNIEKISIENKPIKNHMEGTETPYKYVLRLVDSSGQIYNL